MPEPRRRRRAPDEDGRRTRPQQARTQSRSHDRDDAERRHRDDDAEPRQHDDDAERHHGDDAAGRREGSSGSRRRPPIGQLVRAAREQLEDLIGRPVNATLGFERQDEGWQLTVEVVELERIPETTSILGCYRALVDQDGELLEYRRVRRYSRSQPDEDI